MIVLGIETSTRVCSVGLARDGQPWKEKRLVEARVHSEKLLTLIQTMMQAERIVWERIDAIAVSNGPGSFTGLRIGLSTAKGLCFANDKPLVTVPTLESIALAAHNVHKEWENILVAIDAKKGDFYCGAYGVRDGSLRTEDDSAVISLDRLRERLGEKSRWLVLTDSSEVLAAMPQERCKTDGIDQWCRGDIVAVIGAAMVKEGRTADVTTCEPFYRKDFTVVERSSRN